MKWKAVAFLKTGTPFFYSCPKASPKDSFPSDRCHPGGLAGLVLSGVHCISSFIYLFPANLSCAFALAGLLTNIHNYLLSALSIFGRVLNCF